MSPSNSPDRSSPGSRVSAGAEAHPRRLLGCIADDVTGATDLADALAERGFVTEQLFGLPDEADLDGVDAVVVGLKTRTSSPSDAVEQATRAADWLRLRGATHLFDKYCSTFDSTPEGNIGPVSDALLDLLGSNTAVHCPAYPQNGRTVYEGHLFVGSQLLHETGMANHPLTPMTDSNLVRVLRPQTPHVVGHLALGTVRDPAADPVPGPLPVTVRHLIADAISEADLEHLGRSCASSSLACGSAAFGAAFASAVLGPASGTRARPPAPPRGFRAILVGSASEASRGQVADFRAGGGQVITLSVRELARDAAALGQLVRRTTDAVSHEPVLVAVDNDPAEVARVQLTYGREESAALVEAAMGHLALALVGSGVNGLVVAGGETSGAVVRSLGVARVLVGPRIAPGVPWTVGAGDGPSRGVAMAFKSGNFGGPGFFREALAVLEGRPGWI